MPSAGPMAKQTLESWIREALVDEDKDGELAVISLMHIGQAGEKEVHTVRFGAKAHDPAVLGRLFKHKAEGFGSEMPGVQQFCLCAFYKSRDSKEIRSEPEARHPFMINGELDYGGLATEAPNAQGLVSQTMRHNEVLAQTYLRGNANLIEAQTSMIGQLVSMNQRLMVDNHSALEVLKTVVLEKAQDDHKLRMEQAQFQRSSAERAKWLGMLPMLANNLFGKEVFPVNAEATAILESVATQLNENQLKQIGAFLPPEIWAPMAAWLEKFLADKREQEERTDELGGKVNAHYELGGHVNGSTKAVA